jgi:hypothetical protein
MPLGLVCQFYFTKTVENIYGLTNLIIPIQLSPCVFIRYIKVIFNMAYMQLYNLNKDLLCIVPFSHLQLIFFCITLIFNW